MNDVFIIQEPENTRPLSNSETIGGLPETLGTVFLGNFLRSKKQAIYFLPLLVVFIIFAIRLTQFQIVQGAAFLSRAENNRIRTIPIPAKRGLILDAKNRILAENIPAFFLQLIPNYLPKGDERRDLFMKVADITGVDPKTLEDALAEHPEDLDSPIIVDAELSKESALALMVQLPEASGVGVSVNARRRYPFSSEVESLSHILGYLGKLTDQDFSKPSTQGYLRNDLIGRTGLEAWYEKTLRGVYGTKKMEVDVKGNLERIIAVDTKNDGDSLRLSIDADLQIVSEDALRLAMKQFHSKAGSVVVMNPNTGKILSLVSLPAYDNGLFTSRIDPEIYKELVNREDHPLYARAVSGEYPSGSTIKILYAAAGLDAGVITPTTTVSSVGGIRIGQWFFPDWKAGGHGIVDVRRAIAESVNTFFYILSGGFEDRKGLGVTLLKKYAEKFGLDQKLGIDLPGERPGFFPTPEWKQEKIKEPWYIGDTYHVGIGQGYVLVTPLQVAQYTSIIANGGRFFTPTVVDAFLPQKSPEILNAPKLQKTNIVSDEALRVVREGMRRTITSGSARSLKDLPIQIAGKTGTAQTTPERKPHAWFTSFGPYKNPEIVVTVLLEEGGEGSTSAIPVARAIYEYWATEHNSQAPAETATDGGVS